ncbi:hypothetical protein D3C86_411350 [compost metagenome]
MKASMTIMTLRSLSLAGLLAGTLLVAPAHAQSEPVQAEPVRLENSLTSGGLNIAPRYLDHVGDVDLNLLMGFVQFPSTGGAVIGGQIGLQARVLDQLQLLANTGPLTEIGLRGPLFLSPSFDLGWDARYRNEIYFANDPGFGLNTPLLPLFPGASAQGPEVKLNAAAKWGGFQLFVTPLAAWMSNRTVLGLEGGLDWAWRRWGLGYSMAYRANVSTPFPGSGVLPSEMQHGLGLRYSLDERTFLQANAYLIPGDSYGTANQMILAGFGRRIFGTFKAPAPLQAFVDQLPLPKPVPVAVAPKAEPTPEPTPDPVVEPVVVIAEPKPDPKPALRGRILHSLLPKAEPGIPVKLELKRRTEKGFALAPETTVANPDGSFAFESLPDGEYQLVYRDHAALPDTPAVLVSEAIRVASGIGAELTLDLAWDDRDFTEALLDGSGEVRWTPLADGSIYQVLVNRQGKNILAFPEAGTEARSALVTLSKRAREQQPTTFVKFWKKGDAFSGKGFYGQSRPRPVASQEEK